MIAKRYTIILLILIISLLNTSCGKEVTSSSAFELQQQKYEAEIAQLKGQLDSMKAFYEADEEERKHFEDDIEKYEIAKRERELFREDIVKILGGMENGTLLGTELPIFIGFDNYTNTQKKHVELIKEYLVQWKKQFMANEDFTQEIKPVMCFFSVAPKKPVNIKSIPGDFYYSVQFYQAAAAKIPNEENGCIRGSFDGLRKWFLHIEKKDGKWQVITFGPDT
ncbi:MAG: hypothetical protein ACM3TR_19005 [Caulobacteraceae bacterium]